VPSCANLSLEFKAAALASAIEHHHPGKAAEMRAWNLATRRAVLEGLDQGLVEGHASKVTEL
jgi:hypothetical protein